MGMLIGIIVISQSVVTPLNENRNEETKQQSNTEDHQDFVQVKEAVTSSPSQINLDFQSVLLEEVAFEEEQDAAKSPFEVLIPSTQKALKILFRQIISPNAP